jgi:hypothetical protein
MDGLDLAIQENKMKQMIIDEINKIIFTKRKRVTVNLIRQHIQENLDFGAFPHVVRHILRKDMGLTWKRITHQAEYVNSEVNILKRRNFALDLLKILLEGKVIINYNESIISGTTS